MKYLAIDYGLSHIGLAISDGILAEPFGQLKYENDEKLASDIYGICIKEKIDRLVIGISEGEMEMKTKQFAKLLAQKTGLDVYFVDETLTSYAAARIMVESGKKKRDRQTKSHQVAAAIILQDYLDNI